MCEDFLTKKDENKEIKKKKKSSQNKQFLILIENIKSNIKNKAKNELILLIYVLLEKSIRHQFEQVFTEEIVKIC